VTNYYVYYRVDIEKLSALRPFIEKLFETIERETGVRGRWMRRRDDPTTYMEVYEGVADDAAFEALLERESAGLGLERRVERFRIVPTCA
jgi:quinol monooxygenase YgiN